MIGYLATDFIEHLKDYRNEQIPTLEIDTLTKNISYIIEGLICLFPRVERSTFTCRCRRLSTGNSSREVHVWIGAQMSSFMYYFYLTKSVI